MSQRRTGPRISPVHSPEGGGSNRVGLFSLWKCPSICDAPGRRFLACISGTITMCLVGTVYGWTNSSFLPLTTGIGDVPLRLTHDEYSWSVSLTVLSSMIGSLLTAHLADRIGRKYCLIACSIVFTLGWLHIYFATSVRMLYFARGILGIGVGIARTINPMFLSEVADIKLRGRLGTLIATNVYFGSLVAYIQGLGLTYTSHLLALAGISAISILPLIYIRETPYFLVAKGKKEQACKSIAYYKGIEYPDQVRVELRALRAEARYGLHPPSYRDLSPPYRSNLPSQSIRETQSEPTREVVGTEATSDLNLPSSSDSHSQSIPSVHSKFKCEIRTQATGELRVENSRDSHGLPLQTTRELQSQSASDLHRPSTSQIHRPPTSQIHPDPTCEKHQASTSEKHPEATSEIHPETTSEILPETTNDIPRPSTSQINRPSTSEIPPEITREIHPEATSGIHQEATSEVHPEETSEIHAEATSETHPETTSGIHPETTSEILPETTREIHTETTNEIHRPSTSQIHRPSTSEIPPEITREIHPETISGIHQEATSEIHPEATSEIHPEATSETHPETTSEIHPETRSEILSETTRGIHPNPTCEIHQASTSQIHRPSTSQILPETRSELHSRARSDLRTQSRVDSRASTDISEPYMDLTKYTCLEKLRAILQRPNRKALFIMLGLIMAQHLSGNFTATQYVQDIISRNATSILGYSVMICMELIRLLSGYLIALRVDSCGRRKLLILSATGTIYISFLLTFYFYSPKRRSIDSVMSFIPISHFLLYQGVFHIGLGVLPNVFLCDLFPTKLKGIVGAIVVIFDGIIGFTASELTQVITDNIGVFENYAFFWISCLIALVMMLVWVPETGGKTYREIEELLLGENFNSLNEEISTNERDTRRI
ncbi:uncharacterized protein LOC117242098 [Bombus vosnesenskii]|uniref:Uncharacterized protein LOC117242098 n=1 Tax=Bombus vosnesenskii TaxID=207650 RepID=A0A6J3LKG0_9HYME|nr:uncharacterized protein LOC117242098 [Bombus vosnesenskii]